MFTINISNDREHVLRESVKIDNGNGFSWLIATVTDDETSIIDRHYNQVARVQNGKIHCYFDDINTTHEILSLIKYYTD